MCGPHLWNQRSHSAFFWGMVDPIAYAAGDCLQVPLHNVSSMERRIQNIPLSSLTGIVLAEDRVESEPSHATELLGLSNDQSHVHEHVADPLWVRL